MTYRISGLDPAPYARLFGQPDDALAAAGAVRMTADAKPGYPCRVTLRDAEPGETLLLVNHVSQPEGPYRASHAIFVIEGAREAASYVDRTPPVFAPRILSLRGFDGRNMMTVAALAQPGEADAAIRTMLEDDGVHEIHVHNAVRGCFAAKVERTA